MNRPSSAHLRKRLKRRETADQVRFITFSCHRRLPLFSHPRICENFLDLLLGATRTRALEVIAWVIMPEHVHLLLRPGPTEPLGSTLARLKSAHAKRVISRWRELDAPILRRVTADDGPARFFQPGGGFDRNVRDDSELAREIRYIHDNPVTRGLVSKAEEWRWTSVRWWMGLREGEFPCVYPRGRGWSEWRGFVSPPE